MGTIKELFEKAEGGTLTYEQFDAATKAAGMKLADLSEGNYVSKRKYDDDIGLRDGDLTSVRKQLEKANGNATKLEEVTRELATLQEKYKKQANDFSVREYANGLKFTSNAAKRDFITAMSAKGFEMNEGGKLIGATDFYEQYKAENADAFVVDKPVEDKPAPAPQPEPKPQPTFVGSTPGILQPQEDKGFKFNFIGVRPHE